MEAERILAEAMPCEIRIATPAELGSLLDEDLFELLVLDVDLVEEVAPLLRRRQESGTRVILTTLMAEDLARVDEFPGSAAVAKPFFGDELAAAARAAFRLVPELDH
ncbi:protein of unknown function [Pseudorhizobium banfieldiae]|uniref:Response regulatory domain-containing protein n=1 Tax=Pseudorhizobium banfieldiae TaxID=1125847 RepID=L0NIE3_9HYPH|nr:hypothetical protein [Pseudorhizobium banfieldiae]CAD6616738.1 DNA-binding response regulator [arsenite-oxidising bacterium NT-25]CAD6620348.1 DNA-binding response regulator [Rhizobium sp. TCK]CCF20586.1 protein of unknown function [Pseudorhizobium banfieldiae]